MWKGASAVTVISKQISDWKEQKTTGVSFLMNSQEALNAGHDSLLKREKRVNRGEIKLLILPGRRNRDD